VVRDSVHGKDLLQADDTNSDAHSNSFTDSDPNTSSGISRNVESIAGFYFWFIERHFPMERRQRYRLLSFRG